ncbi:beta-1,4 N-acetylgalactosaminyltransferase 1-like [Saccoglossus kowalevskii]|uniref:Beta-1,4 N-acetylgalactosaminyltransferase 1-like n=1 Tax=Saccoglossus kowalevskii TaxID=10224 RepID=A0A0U2IDP4_SACKO|nr:PREDICTED: beta-1,4 N-acetylgalactosaminyltransferase 1-like [Saccoglossus kowalevskii]ALR88580.1 beta-14 n-acetylgalactosaminyltransferase 1-like 538 [Saccoglossus kowalevskii]
MKWSRRTTTIVGICFLGIHILLYKLFTSRTKNVAVWNKIETHMEHLRQQMEFQQGSKCSCPEPTIGPLNIKTFHRQKKEYIEWEQQENKMAEPMTLCPAMSPIRYLGSGITVEPLSSVRVVGIEIDSVLKASKDLIITLTSRLSLGHIYVEPFTIMDLLHIEGNNSGRISIETEHIDHMNSALSHLIYNSKQHHIRQRDYIDVSILNSHVVINILIQRNHVPRLYDPGPDGDIIRKVTVVAKTFERYECVKRLISSINTFYPNMTIIVADDSEKKEELTGSNVKHFLMPFLEGYAAGKNLVVSQVRTKYLLMVDDDFVFTNETILERFVEKLESGTAELDLVAGVISNTKGKISEDTSKNGWSEVEYVKHEDGGCLFKRDTPVKRVEGFPNCILKDMVINFFMAKTEAIRKVGFDLVFERISHREFFVDALGYLRIAQCDDVIIRHNPQEKTKHYRYYRGMQNQTKERSQCAERILFKNNLQCLQSWNNVLKEYSEKNNINH